MWRATRREIVHVGKEFPGNYIVVVDADRKEEAGSAASTLIDFVTDVNPSATTIRLHAQNLLLPADIIESIADLVRSVDRRVDFNLNQMIGRSREASHEIGELIRRNPLPLANCRSITSHTIPALSPSALCWDIDKLETLLRFLFPGTAVTNTCEVSTNSLPLQCRDLSGIRLALFLATVKVMRGRQLEKGRAELSRILNSIDGATSCSLRFGVFSVHSVIVIQNGQHACIEASAAAIIIRPVESDVMRLHQDKVNTINTQLCCNEADVSTLMTLFRGCAPHKLEKRAHISPSSVPRSYYPTIQSTYAEVPVPAGWWFDGVGYVDVHGTRLDCRPDMDALLEMYVEKKNAEIESYNDIIQDVSQYL